MPGPWGTPWGAIRTAWSMFLDRGDELLELDRCGEAMRALDTALEIADANDDDLARVVAWMRLAELDKHRVDIPVLRARGAPKRHRGKQWKKEGGK